MNSCAPDFANSARIYPEYTKAKPALAAFFKVSPDELLLTNGTDEAIQVLINTYIDDDAEVIVPRPSYAMYRFYAEVAGAKINEVDYKPPTLAFPLEELLELGNSSHSRHPDLKPE